MGQGHYPYISAIESYGNGGFRFAGMSHRGSILCLPTGMHAWSVTSAAQIDATSLRPVLEQADKIDVLLVGLGKEPAFFDPDVRAALRDVDIIVEAVSTASAISTYNILLNEDRAVAGALVAVERPPGPPRRSRA